MHPYYNYGWGIGGLVMMIMMILFWAALIVGIIYLIKYLAQQPRMAGQAPAPDQAMQTLRERYARGEINREEFEERKKDLSESGA